jgi:hypothetical protein
MRSFNCKSHKISPRTSFGNDNVFISSQHLLSQMNASSIPLSDFLTNISALLPFFSLPKASNFTPDYKTK